MSFEEEIGAGRSRGRARGRPPSGSVSSELHLMSLASGSQVERAGGNGGSGEAASRGRGGFFPTRPAGITSTVGEGGKTVGLFANYIELKTPEKLSVQQYQIDFEPNIEATRLRRSLLYESTKTMFNNAFLFDGMHDLKTLTRLPNETTTVSATRRDDNSVVTIKMKHVGEMAWGSFEMLRLYNTQMRRNLSHLNYVLMGRHFFDPTKKQTIQQFKIDIWSGVTTAVNIYEGNRTLMVVDTVHKVVRADTAHAILKEIFEQDRNNFKDNARRELAGAIVLTSYNNKTYKVDDIDFEKNPSFEFDHKGTMKSIKQYYQQQYQVNIKDEKQPLLTCLPSARDRRATDGPPKPILLVPELCRMTGLTDKLRTDFNLKKQMTQMTQLVPNDRFRGLKEFIQSVNANAKVQEEMGNWQLKFDGQPLAITGRELVDERILMKGDAPNQGAMYVRRTGDFSKEIRGKAMRESPGALANWALIVTKRDEGYVRDFGETMARVCGPLGMTVNKATIEILQGDRTGDFVNACNKIANPNLQIIVIIVPNNNKERYDTIKKILCIDKPVPSQVIVGRTLSKKPMLMSVCTKIGIQIAAKLGGVPWSLNIPPKKLMIVGYDTYHDSTQKNKSAGAFVCTLNNELSKYYSRVSYHTNSDEMSSHFAANVASGLKEYFKVNGALPERLIIYRDGVGDGQIPHVFTFEVGQIREGLKEIDKDETIKLTFIIVTKRVNSRFFLKGQPPNLDNPTPGTIIDTVVTRPERYEFYLVSQSVRQGTVAPTCFNVIVDESGWQAKNQHMLAFKLCHLYYNWMGTIRVPAPCQYAHKLAYLVGTSLHREPSTRLANKLFYL